MGLWHDDEDGKRVQKLQREEYSTEEKKRIKRGKLKDRGGRRQR